MPPQPIHSSPDAATTKHPAGRRYVSDAAYSSTRRAPRATSATGPSASSVPEVAPSCKNHRDAVLVGRGDYFGILHGSARLNDRFRARVRDHVETVAERKERIRRTRRS